MLDRNYQIDPNYLHAHHAELIRAAEAECQQKMTSTVPGLRDRLYNAVGDHLIALGQRLKRETDYNELCQDCG